MAVVSLAQLDQRALAVSAGPDASADEINRLRAELAKVVIANAEVAHINALQAETIQRLRDREAELIAQIEQIHAGLDKTLENFRRRL